jgi:cytochrome c oxidase cbb3-type subunit III
MKMNKIFLILITLLNCGFLFAGEKDYPSGYYDIVALFFILILVSIFIAFFYFGMGEGKIRPAREKKSFLQLSFVNKYLTGSTPIEKEGELLLADDYDGIKELDNKVPPWFNYLFYGSILFAVYYMLDYHVFETSPLQEAEYAEEMNIAKQQRDQLAKSGAFITEETVTFVKENEALEKGKQVYNTHCVACHATDGGGLVGPNLTDQYWIHGGSINDIFKTIKYGVPAKGMISWQQQLNPVQIQDVSSYILTLQGTQPQNPKAPEGVPFSPADSMKTLSMR